MSPEQQAAGQTNGAPPPDTTVAVAKVEPSMEMLRYKEELAEKMGLPSSYAMALLKELCNDLVISGFAPMHFKQNPMALYLAAMRGREMGLSPMESIMETFWAAPGGRLGMYANKMLDLMHRSGVVSKFITETKERCEILFTPPGGHQPYTASFEFVEAQAAMLVKVDSNWIKWPVDMNRARAIARGWRALLGTFKGGSANMYAKEELEDMPYTPAQSDIPEGEPVVEVQAGKRKKGSGSVVEMPGQAAPAGPVIVEATAVSVVSEVFQYDFLNADEPPQSQLEVARVRAQNIANLKSIPVTITRLITYSDGATKTEAVGVFEPAAPVTAETTVAADPPLDPAKEAILSRTRIAYAAIPGEEKLRKQIGDMFLSGFFGVQVPREWPRNLEDRTRGCEALEVAVRSDMPRLTASPVSARDYGKEVAADAAAMRLAAAPVVVDPSAPLYQKMGWSPETCAVAVLFKTKFGIEPQDFADYVASLKLDKLQEIDARACMAVAAVMGRSYKAEGSTEEAKPLKTLFSLAEKGAGSFSQIVSTLEAHNKSPLASISPAKIMADLTTMLTAMSKPQPPAADDW